MPDPDITTAQPEPVTEAGLQRLDELLHRLAAPGSPGSALSASEFAEVYETVWNIIAEVRILRAGAQIPTVADRPTQESIRLAMVSEIHRAVGHSVGIQHRLVGGGEELSIRLADGRWLVLHGGISPLAHKIVTETPNWTDSAARMPYHGQLVNILVFGTFWHVQHGSYSADWGPFRYWQPAGADASINFPLPADVIGKVSIG